MNIWRRAEKKRKKFFAMSFNRNFSPHTWLCWCSSLSSTQIFLEWKTGKSFSAFCWCVPSVCCRMRSLNSHPKCVARTHPQKERKHRKRIFKAKVVMWCDDPLTSFSRAYFWKLSPCVGVRAALPLLHHIIATRRGVVQRALWDSMNSWTPRTRLSSLPLEYHCYWKRLFAPIRTYRKVVVKIRFENSDCPLSRSFGDRRQKSHQTSITTREESLTGDKLRCHPAIFTFSCGQRNVWIVGGSSWPS